MNKLQVSTIQTDIYWQDVDANLAMLEEKIWQIDSATDLIVLPEMFNTGFSMNAEKLAEPPNFKTFLWLKQMAKQFDAAICGSYIVKEEGKYYNRLCFVEPNGDNDFYNKRHLFRMGDEHLTYTQGKKRLIYQYKGWKVMPQVCYDLRFPVWSKNRYLQEEDQLEYDLLIFVANWPAPRSSVWDALLKARALENQCYAIGVNRTGSDGEGVNYNGQTTIYDFKGSQLIEPSDEQGIESATLVLDDLQAFRKKFPVYLDWDKFNIE